MQSHHYRPDIEGLRAIAVLSVVGFHASPNWITGGFVGVDIFFVISGYLITRNICAGLEKNTFGIGDFYSRRIRRIFPALCLVLLFSSVLGWFYMLALEYRSLGKHIAGAASFIENILYYNEQGYFDESSLNKPLLQLWSLGVEEQFYLPPRQNSCRLDMMMDMGAIGNRDGTLRGSIQEPGCGAVVAAGKRGDWNGGQGGWRVAADTGTLA